MFKWISSSTATPMLTFTENAVTLNSAAASHFSDTRYVMIGIDEKEGQIAIRPITRKECELNLYPKDSLYKLTVGKGYARVTNKSVCAQIQQLFSCRLDNMKLPAYYDDNENLLIAEFLKRGDEV